MSYHEPVLAQACIDALNIDPNGTYVDATYGGGGHAKKILNKLNNNGRLIAFDQDEDAANNVVDTGKLIFVPANFRHLKRFLRLHGIRKVDGILADLGVSSFQLDEASRGFSFRFDAQLDMRMNQKQETSAQQVINTYSAEQLQAVLGEYGEVRNARTLAKAIVEQRTSKKIMTIGDFLTAIEPYIRGQKHRYLAQVFQAIRIEVNDEMGALKKFLEQSLEMLKPEGRIVIISYHSIEDRIVKKFLKTGSTTGEVEKDFYGNIYRPFKIITKKAVLPDEEEIKSNSRARSAKLRIAEKQKEQE